MLDLDHATRDEVIRIILDQRDALADQERRLAAQEQELAAMRQVIAHLTAQLGTQAAGRDDDAAGSTPKDIPGLKPTQAPVREPKPRTQRAHGAGRRRMQATAQVIHALDHCPDCGAPLAGGTRKRRREVIELPAPTIVVTEHVFLERQCPDCGKRCVPQPDLTGEVMGPGRLGHRLTSLMTVLREDGRLPVRTIQSLLATLTGVHLSVGALVGAVQRVAPQAAPVVAAFQEQIRASPVVHADETGVREGGRNRYVWTFCTPRVRLFVADTREKRVLRETLGDACAAVIVSDFYGADTSNEGVHQFCWAHLLRDIHALTEQQPEDAAVAGWAAAVHAVFVRAQAGASGKQAARWQVQQAGAGRAEAAVSAVARSGCAAAPALCPHPAALGKSVRLCHRAGRAGHEQCGRAQPAATRGGAQDSVGGPARRGAPRPRCGWPRCSAPGDCRASIPTTPAAPCSRPLKSEQLLLAVCALLQSSTTKFGMPSATR